MPDKTHIREAIGESLNDIALEDVEMSSPLFNGLLDSFDLVSLITELEEKLQVSIPIEDVTVENFSTGNSIFDLINSLMRAQ